ncbi:MAG: hypothetical protein QXL01_01040 [Thermoplasmatales archaeon]
MSCSVTLTDTSFLSEKTGETSNASRIIITFIESNITYSYEVQMQSVSSKHVGINFTA